MPSPRRSVTNAAMHRRLVLQDPVSRAAIWSRRLAWFGLTVLVIALALFRREPSIPGLAPIAGAYAIVAVALALALIAFIRIWQAGHRGVGMAAGAFLLCLAMLAPAAYAAFRYATLPPGGDVSTDIEDPPSFSRSTAALKARAGHVPPDMPADQRKLQRRAYPKAVSIVLEVPAEAGFAAAQRAATALRWQVVEAIRPGGRTGGRADRSDRHQSPYGSRRRYHHPHPPSRRWQPDRHPLGLASRPARSRRERPPDRGFRRRGRGPDGDALIRAKDQEWPAS